MTENAEAVAWTIRWYGDARNCDLHDALKVGGHVSNARITRLGKIT